ncbi:hypothetical protein, partial [Elizabethkingia meningoseptica]|uniref:hypothetical protein n=1 Tax=Elizabethkingia meningoseptica TaxID=238 RepID=UPI00389290F7
MLHKFPTLGRIDLIFFGQRSEAKFYFAEFAGIQKMQCACRLFLHFSMLALTTLIICSFALMQKNQKIKALMHYSRF